MKLIRSLVRRSLLLVAAGMFAANAAEYRSHPPMRPLPAASKRPLAPGPGYYVDPVAGREDHDGSAARPWRDLQRAIGQLRPGDTLYLRGGIYYGSFGRLPSGTAGKPITIRSYPNELAILDGGLREFFENPAGAWEPVPAGEGVEGEYRSKRAYPQPPGGADRGGNFGDSMIPLFHGQDFDDLRTNNEFMPEPLPKEQKITDAEKRAMTPEERARRSKRVIYGGPGAQRDPATNRIHVRLAHTGLAGLGQNNYRGETDPRRIPLVVLHHEVGLRIDDVRHVRIQDLVVRGARIAIDIRNAAAIELDHLTVYAGSVGLRINGTRGLRLVHSTLRGHAAPWTSREHHKNHGGSDYLVLPEVGNHDFEFAYNEFTDGHDGLKIGRVDPISFHHNLVDNFNDDGIEVSAPKPVDGERTWSTLHVFQNRISRCQNVFSLHNGAPVDFAKTYGVYVYRNVFDLRRGLYRAPPRAGEPPAVGDVAGASPVKPNTEGKAGNDVFDFPGGFVHEHGGPVYPPMYFYHNTIIARGDTINAGRGLYAQGAGGRGIKQSRRRVFNNLVIQTEGQPGLNFGKEKDLKSDVLPGDLQVGGNLFWSLSDGSRIASESLALAEGGHATRDLFVDPRFTALTRDPRQLVQLTLQASSPAIDGGVRIPAVWLDPVREADASGTDIGALPAGAAPWNVGVEGRHSAFQ